MSSNLKYILFFTLLLLGGIYLYRKYRVAPQVDLNKLELFYLDGQSVKWQEFRGRNIILSFGASWCGNCRDELKEIAKIKESKLKDVQVIVISDEDMETVQRWSQFKNYPFTFLKMNSTFPAIGINSIPVSYIINKDLEVKQQEVGYIDWSDEGTVESILDLYK